MNTTQCANFRVARSHSAGFTIPDNNWQLRLWGETRNLLDVAYLILKSAVERTESPGKHYQLDYPQTDPHGQVPQKSRTKPTWMNVALGSLGSWLLATALTAIPALGSERISLIYGPLQFSLSIDALEVYAREGRVTNEFAFYAKRASPQQLAALQNILQTRLPVNPTTVSQFTYSRIGERVLEQLGQILQTESGIHGFKALRAALILAAADPEGLTVVNMLRLFPSRSIRLDLNQSLRITKEVAQLLKQRQAIVASIQHYSATKAASIAPVDFSQQPDLQRSGPFTWQKVTLTLNDPNHQRVTKADIYLPQRAGKQSAPVIVISHGVASDLNTFAYLAQHLASYGFAVAVLEHADNAQRFRQFYAGLARPPQPIELIARPMEVKHLLDELQRLEKSHPALWLGRLNLQQVGVIGQSMGGYTALALAGAKINFEQLREDCSKSEPSNIFMNLSLLVQCDATELASSNYDLQDKRVKAVIAINPLTSSIHGQSGLSQIQVPLMLVAGSADIFTPAVPEQIVPFTWLTTPKKYLVLVEKSTHFSMLSLSARGGGLPPLPPALLGSEQANARRYLKLLSVAFAQTHVANRPEYQSYLGAAYAQSISQVPLELSLVQSLTVTQLDRALDDSVKQKTASSCLLTRRRGLCSSRQQVSFSN